MNSLKTFLARTLFIGLILLLVPVSFVSGLGYLIWRGAVAGTRIVDDGIDAIGEAAVGED